jgi:hypothetical protein
MPAFTIVDAKSFYVSRSQDYSRSMSKRAHHALLPPQIRSGVTGRSLVLDERHSLRKVPFLGVKNRSS